METAFGKRLDRVRQASPLVHCISNLVTANDCANIVLAAGASPIMADAPEEVREITALSRALCLSLGTPNPRKADAMFLAGRKAAELGLPVVFDPVGVGASAYRQEIARKLLQDIPLTVLRCNASELQTLSGQSLVSRGVDAGKAPELETLLPLAGRFAAAHHCIVAVTGAEDIVTDGTTAYGIRSGTPLLRQVTGTGCMLSVLAAAFVGANPEAPLEAAAAAVCMMGLCGERAAASLTGGEGTGTLRIRLMDAVSNMTGEELDQGANYELYC
ncbi:hydroxyethylthiazole kinase [Faecalibacterium prausnitzii]|uniref:Hydroxyethylthiazole kinase n=1 Tax=Faecalibacterium prausnitzii TaxID=853 RepID=A0A2A7AMG0_9FIRM|nr:hydroxyethylthiazole kinase [Faecalibacterium prausnitzii]PDX80337.1 hydroxyethylthiazole kinase [Faecalibacterium prausnitzii]